MTARVPAPSREIDGKGRTVSELLAGRKYSTYSIDYCQREYRTSRSGRPTSTRGNASTNSLPSRYGIRSE